MGECGCAQDLEDHAVRLPSGVVVAYGSDPGCPECFNGIGFSLKFYSSEAAHDDWRPFAKPEAMEPDEYGGREGQGDKVPLLEVADLIEAAKSIEADGCTVGEDDCQYGSIADWLEDFGLTLLRDAMERCAKREAREGGGE